LTGAGRVMAEGGQLKTAGWRRSSLVDLPIFGHCADEGSAGVRSCGQYREALQPISASHFENLDPAGPFASEFE